MYNTCGLDTDGQNLLISCVNEVLSIELTLVYTLNDVTEHYVMSYAIRSIKIVEGRYTV